MSAKPISITYWGLCQLNVRWKGRSFMESRFHKHLTYSNMGSTLKRQEVVDKKQLKVGEPASASLALGDMTEARKFQFDVQALNARGFLRFQRPYSPPSNAAEKIMDLSRMCLKCTADDGQLMSTRFSDSRQKYDLLSQAFEEFQHAVPNSMLYMMNTVGDIVEFYCTPINVSTPYEELIRSKDLPPNLHIQKEPVRFHPDTDTMFNGESAFHKRSNIVTGLRAKKKYRGHEAKMTWP